MIVSFRNLASANVDSSSHDLVELEGKGDWFGWCVLSPSLLSSTSTPIPPHCMVFWRRFRDLCTIIYPSYLDRHLSSFILRTSSVILRTLLRPPSEFRPLISLYRRSATITLDTVRVVGQISRNILNMR